jgi:hypothetical protein
LRAYWNGPRDTTRAYEQYCKGTAHLHLKKSPSNLDN